VVRVGNISLRGNKHQTLRNVEFRVLWKIYNWYLTKDTEKYNVNHDNGMYVINRYDISFMGLSKDKQMKEIKENNDET